MPYTNLLSSSNIGGLKLRNRIMLSAMGSNFCEEDGTCNERLIRYYENQAKGGAGLIILETSAAAWPSGATTPNAIGFSEDRFVPGLSKLVDRVHKHGAAIAAQLNHGGKASNSDVANGRPVYLASKPKRLKGGLMSTLSKAEIANFVKAAGPDGKGPRYKIMDQEDINNLISSFSSAASRALTAGFDAIEIHAGHGYMLSGFLSPFANDRDDQYGGSAENRSRLLCEIISSIRSEVPSDFPIIVRLDAHEFRIDGGTTINDAVSHAQFAVTAGANAIDVSGYGNGLSGLAFTEAPLVHQPAGLLEFAKTIKNAVNVPVIAVGRIEVDVAEQEIKSGAIDFVAMGRKLLADPELPNKLATEPKSVRPCIYCYVCVSKIFLDKPMVCAVNPGMGREDELGQFILAESPKDIAVVGAGPAGLEAARVLALRGHEVTLIEKTNKLGGTARIAALPYRPNGELVEWLIYSVKQLAIKIEMNTEVDADTLASRQFDHIVLAVGATRSAPPMQGKDHRHVFDGDELRGVLFGDSKSAMQKLPLWQRLMVTSGRLSGLLGNIGLLRFLSKIWMPLGKRVVLIGGDLVGLELAEYLLERHRHVTVLEPSDHLGTELSLVRRARVVSELRNHGVEMITNATVTEITKDAVHYSAAEGNNSVPTDSVIISLGADNNRSLANQLGAKGVSISNIGDGQELGYIEGAILSARKLAVNV